MQQADDGVSGRQCFSIDLPSATGSGGDAQPVLFLEALLNDAHLSGWEWSKVANCSSRVSNTGMRSWLLVATKLFGVVVR